MSKSILEEAMDDTKLLRETAMENAKNVLLEAISPKIKEFVDTQLGESEVTLEMPMGDEEDDDLTPEEGMYEAKDEEEEEEEEMSESQELVGITQEDVAKALSDFVRAEAAQLPSDDLSEASVSKSFGDQKDPNDVEAGQAAGDGKGERGLEDDEKEEMWKDHEPPASEDWTVKEAAYRKKVDLLAKQNKGLKKENAEYRKACEYLRGQLQEVNLFNSKLVYTQKVLEDTNLTQEQKVTVVEAFDRAKDLEQVELVYKTYSESLTKIAGVLGESKRTKARASRPNSAGTSELLNEQREEQAGGGSATRWQELAGILG